MEALEKLVDFVPRVGQKSRNSRYSTLDECTVGLSRLYSGHIRPVQGPQFEIQPLNQQSLGWGVEPYQPPSFEPVGEPYGIPTQWEPPAEYGIGGAGEARAIFPGLVERERVDFSGHDGTGIHNNVDYFSIFEIKNPIKPHNDIHFKQWG